MWVGTGPRAGPRRRVLGRERGVRDFDGSVYGGGGVIGSGAIFRREIGLTVALAHSVGVSATSAHRSEGDSEKTIK